MAEGVMRQIRHGIAASNAELSPDDPRRPFGSLEQASQMETSFVFWYNHCYRKTASTSGLLNSPSVR